MSTPHEKSLATVSPGADLMGFVLLGNDGLYPNSHAHRHSPFPKGHSQLFPPHTTPSPVGTCKSIPGDQVSFWSNPESNSDISPTGANRIYSQVNMQGLQPKCFDFLQTQFRIQPKT